MSTQYPVTAQQLLDSGYRGQSDFHLLFEVDSITDPSRITVKPGFPIAVNNKDDRQQIQKDSGIKLPTRYDITTGPLPDDLSDTKIDWTQMYTAATGLALWIRAPGQEDRIYLVQNTLDKKINPGRWNFPSQLVRDALPVQAFTAVNQETGLLIPTKDGTRLIGLNFDLPEVITSIDPELKARILAGRKNQETNLREQLHQKFPDHAGKPIEWRMVQPQNLQQNGATRDIQFNLLSEAFTTHAHVLVDSKYADNIDPDKPPPAQSVNIHFPAVVDLSDLPDADQLDLANIIAVDPEELGRNHGLFSLEKARNLDTIPAPTDYIQTLEL